MGIFYHQFTAVGAAAQPMHAEAVQLATACAHHFTPMAGIGIGIANGSCRAAVAVNFPPNYPAYAGNPFGVMYGNSQLAAQGIAVGQGGGALGAHAERAALTAGAGAGGGPVPLYTVAVAGALPMRYYLSNCNPVRGVRTGLVVLVEESQIRITVLSMG